MRQSFSISHAMIKWFAENLGPAALADSNASHSHFLVVGGNDGE